MNTELSIALTKAAEIPPTSIGLAITFIILTIAGLVGIGRVGSGVLMWLSTCMFVIGPFASLIKAIHNTTSIAQAKASTKP